jgi:hypothetical protein
MRAIKKRIYHSITLKVSRSRSVILKDSVFTLFIDESYLRSALTVSSFMIYYKVNWKHKVAVYEQQTKKPMQINIQNIPLNVGSYDYIKKSLFFFLFPESNNTSK